MSTTHRGQPAKHVACRPQPSQPIGRTKALIAIGCLISLVLISAWWGYDLMRVTRVGQGQWKPAPAMVERLLRSMDIDPESLAACGMPPNKLETLIEGVERYLTLNAVDFEDALIDYEQVSQFLRSTDRSVRERRAGRSLVTTRNRLNNAIKAVETPYEDHVLAIKEQAESALTPAQRSRLRALRSCRAIGYERLPLEFQTIARTEAEWVELRDALAHERISTRAGDSVAPEVGLLLTETRGIPSVRDAARNVELFLQPMQEAWSAAFGIERGGD